MSELAPHGTVQELLMLLGTADTEQVELFLTGSGRGRRITKRPLSLWNQANSNLKTAFHLD